MVLLISDQQAILVFTRQKFRHFVIHVLFCVVLATIPASYAIAGGGSVLASDTCIVKIDFYSVHLTIYQPDSRGSQQFCRELPDTGDSIFVLDYLHPSLKEVPVSLRIIRDVTGLGRFIKLKDVEAIGDLDKLTVFYQPPVIEADGSLKNDVSFEKEGQYIGIISAGYPGDDRVYSAVFPIKVGGTSYLYVLPLSLLLVAAAYFWVRRLKRARSTTSPPGVAQ